MAATRRLLITGGAGFVGQWLSCGGLERGWSVFAGTLDGPPPEGSTVLDEKQRHAVSWLSLDVCSEASIAQAVQTAAPDYVVHLAGLAHAPEANASPIRAFEINALGAQRLLATVPGTTRTLIVGSAEQYGLQDASAYPVPETATQRPLTPYAASKAAQELIALTAHRAMGAEVICTRSFNHSGVGHAATYLLPSLVRRALELPVSKGRLRLGNGALIRDFLHVTDVVEAYLRLLESGTPGEVYNVSSGQGSTVRELAQRVLNRTGVTADISSDATLLRPIDVPILVGDNAKLRAATGWAPRRSLDDLIDDLIHAAKS